MIHKSLDELNKTLPHASYGAVTQLTSKATDVTLNTNSGTITTASDALASGASVAFVLHNSTISLFNTTVVVSQVWGITSAQNYTIRHSTGNGSLLIIIKNESAVSLSEALLINFSVINNGLVA